MKELIKLVSLVVFGYLGLASFDNSSTTYEEKQSFTTTKNFKAERHTTARTPVAVPLESIDHYTNSYGEEVQSPTRYSSVPMGATALCRDNTYSFSKNRRGTCSHHGGVQKWY